MWAFLGCFCIFSFNLVIYWSREEVTMSDTMLTVPDVAAQLKVPEQAVRRWLRTGQLEGIRLGGTKAGWRIEPAAVARFLEQRRQAGKAAA